MDLLRKFLFPFVPLYYLITHLRNKLYDFNIFKSKSYSIPIICVGNLSVGGTGKTPMIEHLIRLLDDKKTATLSRGYKRSTKGFLLANDQTKVNDLGDEPYQFKQKFENVLVAVDEDRQHGIETLMHLKNPPEVILLDDAYQHRKVKAGLNILLTTYDKPYTNDFVLPTGNLREPKYGAKRADVVVVTKCPAGLTEEEKEQLQQSLHLESFQRLFFSHVVYDAFVYNISNKIPLKDIQERKFTLVTGIANPDPLLNFLRDLKMEFEHLGYNDHHDFSESDIELLNQKTLILTTEKDYVRLRNRLENIDLYYLPITISIDDGHAFKKIIRDYVN